MKRQRVFFAGKMFSDIFHTGIPISGVARVPCALVLEIFFAPPVNNKYKVWSENRCERSKTEHCIYFSSLRVIKNILS